MNGAAPASAIVEGFDAYFEREIAPDLEAMEERRKSGVKLFVGLIALAVLGGLSFFFGDQLAAASGIDRNVIMVIGLVCVAGGSFGAYQTYRRVHGAFKDVLVGRTCRFMGLEYTQKDFAFPFDRFMDAELLPDHDTRKLEDRIGGVHDGVDFELCEAQLDRRKRSSGSDDDDNEKSSVFHGLLLRYSFAKPFKGRTIVVPDATWLGNRLVGLSKTGERVTLEDVRFERQFEVYSTDQVEARYLLTPRFMERLTALARHFSDFRGLAVAFDGNDLLVTLRSQVDRFEGGNIFSEFADRSRAEALIEELSLIREIVDILNLADSS